ncbi:MULTISPECIES: prolipoprotein diacylglyceryl transferase [Actinomycetaceae]|uniref:prolipoprotein diacylglyceryl transferase n=1 Tax=Actinomycetaceae TaxID=2049 RepID=UPI00278015E8|nr:MULTISPECIES: prolipoprotein diacylglyceryl transferase [Actinomycetaceae]MDP9834546.1 prolipoprotein diacylglyceryl transferase [Gleimia europaea]MDU4286860.1 prolipoprotein diacylglyceryl transferase [Actinomyces sp.]MDU5568659.1 prolipoprotein diacylglyceryl transferase [Actinomyces sp.]MDU7238696.1 prolipoprotein diacylglyceryl transferase [Actinomyces sp.]
MSVISLLPVSIPSPPQGVWYLGPVPLRAYGIIIACAMVVAVLLTKKRYEERGGNPELVYDVALWAIPFGIVGARLYHVITSPYKYFGPNGQWLEIFRIWEGGIAIMGAVIGGVIGSAIALHRAGQRMGPFADAVAPTLLIAQAMGRFGNWFNQELFGKATTLPWGLEIDDRHLPAGYASGTLFHPTFLYEVIWNLSMAFIIIALDKRFKFKGGQLIFLYMSLYAIGRFWIENLRIDPAKIFLGMRLNAWSALVIIIIGIVGFLIAGKRGASTRVEAPERTEENVE